MFRCTPLKLFLILFCDETWVYTSGVSENKPGYMSKKRARVHTSRPPDLDKKSQNLSKYCGVHLPCASEAV